MADQYVTWGPSQGHAKDISECKAMIGLRVLTDDRAQHKEWRAKFVNVVPQARPGIREILKENEEHKDEPWVEE